MPLPADGTKVKLGKGSILLATNNPAGDETGLEFLGNVTALTLSAEVTKVQLFSSTQRSAPLVAEAVTRAAYSLALTLSEFTLGNLRRFLMGEAATKTQIVGAATTVSFTGAKVEPGKYLDTESRQITNVTVTRDGTDILVEGTDYTVQSEFGLIHLLPDGLLVAAGDAIEVEFDRPALIIDQVRIAKQGTVTGRLVYLADDANQDADGARDRLELWKVSMSPEGAMNLISDEYGSFQMTAGVLSDGLHHPNDPFGTLDRVRAA